MSLRGLVKDALDGLLAITPLSAFSLNSATTTNGTEKEVGSMPLAVAAVLTPVTCPAAHTATVTVQGRDSAAGAWEDVATFAQVTNANTAIQRVNIETPRKRYRTVIVTTGAFGANVLVIGTVHIVGTNVYNAPIVQVN